jgi:hypothetical protein
MYVLCSYEAVPQGHFYTPFHIKKSSLSYSCKFVYNLKWIKTKMQMSRNLFYTKIYLYLFFSANWSHNSKLNWNHNARVTKPDQIRVFLCKRMSRMILCLRLASDVSLSLLWPYVRWRQSWLKQQIRGRRRL